MKKLIAMVLCLFISLSLTGCRNTGDLNSKSILTGKVIEYWGSSVDIEVMESSLTTIEEGTRVFIEKSAMENERNWIELRIDDQVQIVFDAEQITDSLPKTIEVVYEIKLLN